MLWWIAPFWGVHYLTLAVSVPQAQQWLLTHLSGDWSFAAGRQRGLLGIMGYHYTHEYRGIVHGSAVKLIGPFSPDGIPMIIKGELQPYAQISRLRLVIHLSLSHLMGELWRPLLGMIIFALASALLFQALWLVLLVLGLGLISIYFSLVMWIHWQTYLLFQWLIGSSK